MGAVLTKKFLKVGLLGGARGALGPVLRGGYLRAGKACEKSQGACMLIPFTLRDGRGSSTGDRLVKVGALHEEVRAKSGAFYIDAGGRLP